MFAKEWPVLLVDDEPDVLAVTRLALKNVNVDGIPVRLFTAASKAEAIDLLSGPLEFRNLPYLAVAFIDVVMETDTAGLELCRFIREQQHNRLVQLFIRTGQPGLAPEREVIDRYDVSGYFTKVETTQDKLYSLVKAGVRQFDFARVALAEFELVSRATAGDTLEDIARAMYAALPQPIEVNGEPALEPHLQLAMFDNGGWFAGMGYTQEEVHRERDRLESLGMQPIGPTRDAMVISGHQMLIKLGATDAHAETYHLTSYLGTPPPAEVLLHVAFTRSIATLVHRARQRVPA